MGTLNSLEDRLRAVEDTLAIYHLIASHPPAADTGTESYYRDAFAIDGVIDLGTKTATGNDKIGAVVKTPEHQAAIASGLCHFAELSGHGLSSGYRIHRLGVNRWDLKRTDDGWKVTKRAYRMLDGTEEGPALLRGVIANETLAARDGASSNN